MRVEISNKNLFSDILKTLFPEFDMPNFNGLTIDSRKVRPGDIFMPLKGKSNDGHQFISQAKTSGASLAFIDSNINTTLPTIKVASTKIFLYELVKKYREQLTFPFFGITGSNGKTTTKDLLFHTLSSQMNVVKTEGNYNSTTGAPLSIFTFHPNADIAIIEIAANQPGEIKKICNVVKPNMGLITNIGETHMKYFLTKNEIAQTKSALFSSLPRNGTAFINIDDPFISEMEIPCTRIEYSLNTSADYNGMWKRETKELILNNTAIDLSTYPQSMAINALAVYSVASQLGFSNSSIISQFSSFRIPYGRGEIIHLENNIIINDTYNSNIDSAKLGLQTLSSYPSSKRKIAVIGDMLELGFNEKKYHEKLGKYLNKHELDAVFAYGNLTKYTISTMHGSNTHKKFYDDKKLLIFDLKEFLQDGDIIYIKGSRRMKMEDVIKGLKS